MPFVKLDCDMLNSTTWFDRPAREIFITALLMATPFEVAGPMPEIATRSLEHTGWVVPLGWYGFVFASSVGIIRRAGLEPEEGMAALERLAAPEHHSRSQLFEGRRLVRVDGGFIVLNFIRYRDRDFGAAKRMRRFRKRKALRVTSRGYAVTPPTVTQAEAEAEAEGRGQVKKEPPPTPRAPFVRPTVEQVEAWLDKMHAANPDRGFDKLSGERIWNAYEAKGWRIKGQAMKNWQAAIIGNWLGKD